MAVNAENQITMSQEDLLLKFLIGDNKETLEELEKINNLDKEENLSPEDLEQGLSSIDELRKQIENVKDLSNFSDEEKNKLMEVMGGRLDMLEMRVQDYFDKRFGGEYSDVDRKYYQESDVGMPENDMPNYRGLMGNRDEDGSLKPMPGKEPRK